MIHSFDPIINQHATLLILGSMPGNRSLQQQQYYAHPRNAFWSIMHRIADAGPELDYPTRLTRLQSARIALWDVLKSCRRNGSLDAAIRPESMQTNDFSGLLSAYPNIQRIAFNGKKAETVFRRHALPLLDDRLRSIDLIGLPSTSPAHAAMTFEQKLDAWCKGLNLLSG